MSSVSSAQRVAENRRGAGVMREASHAGDRVSTSLRTRLELRQLARESVQTATQFACVGDHSIPFGRPAPNQIP